MNYINDSESIKMNRMRRTIAMRMKESLANSAQLTLHSTILIPELVSFKEKNKGISFNDLFLKATALALVKHPRLNATVTENMINQWKKVNIGIAVAIEDGLIVPVIPHVEDKSLDEINEIRKDITIRAQSGELTTEEVTSGSFTISNLGTYPVDSFTPILNPPQVGLLGIGRIQEIPYVLEGTIEIVPIVHLSLTIDHSVIDGAHGAAFLEELESIFQHPESLKA